MIKIVFLLTLLGKYIRGDTTKPKSYLKTYISQQNFQDGCVLFNPEKKVLVIFLQEALSGEPIVFSFPQIP